MINFAASLPPGEFKEFSILVNASAWAFALRITDSA
jgi:hypothetical protein